MTSETRNTEYKQHVESERYENPVRFEYGEGMTHQKLSDPMFQFERKRIYWALVAALFGTILAGPIGYVYLSIGSVLPASIFLVVPVSLWVKAGQRALSLRASTAVVMEESKADRDNVWETHQANRVVRGDTNG